MNAATRSSKRSRRARHLAGVLLATFWLQSWGSPVHAAPTQEDVFRSIQDNVGSSETDSNKFLVFLCIGGGVVILLAIFSKRESRQNTPKAVNHQGRLLKEVMKGLPLKSRDLKQLKILAEQTQVPSGSNVSSPLSLILCPSVLAKAVQNPRSRADRHVLDQILRKAYGTRTARASAAKQQPTAPPDRSSR